MNSRKARQLRDALVVAASFALVLVVGASKPKPPTTTSAAGVIPSHLLPSPLPSGGTPERITIQEQDVDAGCNFADRGFGAYGAWRKLPLGKLLVPPASSISPEGGYDLLVHFHGAEPVRKELAPLNLNLVIAAIDTGTRSSHYEQAFRDLAWDNLLSSINQEVAQLTAQPAIQARHIALSSWSAGSGAVTQILSRADNNVAALILLDSLYAGYVAGQTSLLPGQLASFVAWAQSAARGGAPFYLTHTAIPTTGYASTEQAATFLLRELGASPVDVTPNDDDPLRPTRMYDGGNLYVRGYAGTAAHDHCAQIRLLPAILTDVVLPAWEITQPP